jgi:hypothetical protein
LDSICAYADKPSSRDRLEPAKIRFDYHESMKSEDETATTCLGALFYGADRWGVAFRLSATG